MPAKNLELSVLSFGNIIEWYDFSLYIYFSHTIAQQFFPSHNHFISTLLALSTFFLGSLVRPLGGLLLGWLGDYYHLSSCINLAIITMGLSTFAVALLPTYQMIGIAAPILLILLRILQGLSVGGQFPSLITLAVTGFKHHRGFIIGAIYSISSLGFLLASLIALTINKFLPHNLQMFAWRLPFALSGILFIIYLYLSYKSSLHTPSSSSSHLKKQGALVALLRQWQALLAVILLTFMAAALYYLVFTYLVGYRINHLAISKEKAFLVNSIILVLACILYPLFGYLADRIGYYRIFITVSMLLILTAYPLLQLFRSTDTVNPIISLILFTIGIAALQGAISPLFAIVFEDQWKNTGCAFAYGIGNGLSGGAPLLAEILNHYFQFGLTLFVTLLLMIGFIGMYLIRKIFAVPKINLNTLI